VAGIKGVVMPFSAEPRYGDLTVWGDATYGSPDSRLEIGKHSRDRLLSARILRCHRSTTEIEKIASILDGFATICCQRCDQMGFQVILPKR
jgi:hypothetical protein